VVTLSGKVASAAERRTAVQIAKDTSGVKTVRDRLTVGGQ
jgi:osmotically-inducible protein OsmY